MYTGKITAVLFAAVLTNPAYSAMLCANMNVNSQCSGGKTSGIYDWSIRCGSVDIAGIATCGPANQYGTTLSSITNTGNNCYCKMIYPGVSPWISVQSEFTNIDTCLASCAQTCASKIVIDEDHNIKWQLFNQLRY